MVPPKDCGRNLVRNRTIKATRFLVGGHWKPYSYHALPAIYTEAQGGLALTRNQGCCR